MTHCMKSNLQKWRDGGVVIGKIVAALSIMIAKPSPRSTAHLDNARAGIDAFEASMARRWWQFWK